VTIKLDEPAIGIAEFGSVEAFGSNAKLLLDGGAIDGMKET
jgi:hypothetical protein